MVRALELGHQSIQPLIEMQLKMATEIGKAKRDDYPRFAIDENLKATVYAQYGERLNTGLDQFNTKVEVDTLVNELRADAVAALATEDEAGPTTGDVAEAFDAAYKKVVRSRILQAGNRPDGRGPKDIRPIWCEVNYSPRAHGSGLFTRGETQILTLATLGTPRDAQEMDNLTPTDKKRYIHHYNFPPFSVGETRFLRGASRREVGHGALAERALESVIPEVDVFPYTLRLVSEALSSNGSTSMGSVCGSTLALMDAGVPITAPVSGIAMGLVKEGDRYAILSDIQGVEDHLGDMDFKVAGTPKGITALQMDIKISGLTTEIMSEALAQASAGRKHILDKMLEVLSAPRPEMKDHAPRIEIIKINPEKIGAVIGPGGKIIRKIQEDTGAKIDIEDDGSVYIATSNGESARMAREMVNALTEEAELGRIYTGKVRRVTDFGAFVEIMPGTDGMVHISQLDSEHVEKVEDVARLGEEITVMVTNIDHDGKIRLSRQAVLEGWTVEEAQERDRGSGGSRGGGGRGGGGGRDRRDRGGGNRGGRR
jgi:polyribonucleotide nucleotidyltransferase